MGRFDAIELFVAAVRDGSFSAAARRAGLTPGAVSRRVSDLEATLGIQLLSRSTRKLALTEAGRAYYQRVEKVLEDLDDAEAVASALQSTPRGTLHVHSRTMFGLTVLSPLIPRFQAAYPEIRVELHLSERRILLREEDCDIDFQIAPPRDAGLTQRKMLASERLLVASPGYLAGRPHVAEPRNLEAQNCLTYWLGSRRVVWRFAQQGGDHQEMTVPSTFSSNNGLVLRDLATRGHGIALLDDYTVIDEIANGSLTCLLPGYRVTNTTFDDGIYAVFLESQNQPRKIRAFLDFLSEALRPILARRKSVLAGAGES